MKKLTKAEAKELDELKGAVQAAWHDLDLALQNLRDFRDERVSEMQEYADGKSDKWREGDVGTAYLEWIENWESVDLDSPAEPELDPMVEEPEGV